MNNDYTKKELLQMAREAKAAKKVKAERLAKERGGKVSDYLREPEF